MRFTNLIFWVPLIVVAAMTSACGLGASNAQPTRAATQTPLIVFVPVTTTAEPATVTPLPTVTAEIIPTKSPTRTLTRAPVAVVRTATKTPPPAPAGPTATAAPACAYSPPALLEPNDGAERRTWTTKAGSDTFIFKWIPPQNIGGDDIAYKIQMNSIKKTGKPGGSDTVYISFNKSTSDAQKQQCGNQSCFIYDAQRVHNLPQGDEDITVTWYISVVKFKGNIDDLGYLTGTSAECTGSRTSPRQLHLIVLDG